MDQVYVIAEAGINHNGKLEIAKKLMEMASDAGCNAVKFQKRTPEICVPKEMQPVIRQTPWGEMTYLDYKRKIEFGKPEFDFINEYARDLGIDWSASAWDVPSLLFLDQYDVAFHKVASALTTNLEFLREVALRKKKTFLSTGMCSWEDIDTAVRIFRSEKCPLVLMHTVSIYPADESMLNLRLIRTLSERYPDIPVGYSGHESSVSPSVVAVALGATAIERHITLDRAMWGTDHAASLEPAGLNQLVGSIRKIPNILGDGQRKIVAGENEVAKKLRYWI